MNSSNNSSKNAHQNFRKISFWDLYMDFERMPPKKPLVISSRISTRIPSEILSVVPPLLWFFQRFFQEFLQEILWKYVQKFLLGLLKESLIGIHGVLLKIIHILTRGSFKNSIRTLPGIPLTDFFRTHAGITPGRQLGFLQTFLVKIPQDFFCVQMHGTSAGNPPESLKKSFKKS